LSVGAEQVPGTYGFGSDTEDITAMLLDVQLPGTFGAPQAADAAAAHLLLTRIQICAMMKGVHRQLELKPPNAACDREQRAATGEPSKGRIGKPNGCRRAIFFGPIP
jgi:hypothetical protein